MAGLLGQIFSAGNVAKRQLRDLLGNPVLGAQQMVGNLNDRARNLNEMTAAAAREGVNYGPATQRLAGLMADAYSPMGLTVFHGSPAKFNRFDRTKIGSGEGAQAYGYGHYVAESPNVAKEYRTALSEPELFVKGRQIKTTAGSNLDTAKAWLQDSFEMGAKNPYVDAIEKVSNSPLKDKQGVIDALKKLEARGVQMQKGGFEYEIDLPDEQIAKMLDWDKPLSRQPENVQAALEKLGYKVDRAEVDQYSDALLDALMTDAQVNLPKQPMDIAGEALYRKLGSPEQAAQRLREAGIPGIRYLDQGSRGPAKIFNVGSRSAEFGPYSPYQTMEEAQKQLEILKKYGFKDAEIQIQEMPQTSNFVVFPGNEDLLTILRRNGGLLD